MADHTTAPWGYDDNITTASLAGAQLARRIHRVSPVDVEGGTTGMRTYAFPWTLAADQWGVSYPAGTIAVAYGFGLSGGGSLLDQMLAGWETGANGLLVLVPSALPVGYTARRVREWHSGIHPFAKIRVAGGYQSIDWMPSLSPLGLLGASLSTGSGTAAGTEYNAYENGIGFRRVHVRGFVNSAVLGSVGFTGNVDVVLSHNADGTDPGSADGDTADFTHTFTDADYTHTGGASPLWVTSWVDAGDALAALGVLTYFQASLTRPSTATSIEFGLDFRLSPRVDVPLPYTATGIGDLIAPGGLP